MYVREYCQSLWGVALLFLKLGFTASGGPVALVVMMHDDAVRRRKCLDDQSFLDLLEATNLIPRPNSMEMTTPLSFLYAGWPGLFVGRACFIWPAMLIVMALVWVYVRFGATPQASWVGLLPAALP